MERRRRTLTMNWDEFEDDDDDNIFFEPRDRFSSAGPQDMGASSESDEDEYDDSRMSFCSAVSSAPVSAAAPDYRMWMAEPGDVKERRRKLLQGMGLLSNKSLHKIASAKMIAKSIATKARLPKQDSVRKPKNPKDPKQFPSTLSSPTVLIRSRSAGDLGSLSAETKKRKEELIGPVSKQRLTRTFSGLVASNAETKFLKKSPSSQPPEKSKNRGEDSVESFSVIKDMDNDNSYVVEKSNDEEGMWDKLRDMQTGKQMTMDEFDKSVGLSPVVKEVMRRANGSTSGGYNDRKLHMNSYLSRSVKYSKKRGVKILRNIKEVAHSMSGKIIDKDNMSSPNKTSSSQWIKARQHGKPYKEFTGLHLCQEIQAHEGSIWSVKFSPDAHSLASAGEDRVIHVWEVQECDVMAGKPYDDVSSVGSSPLHPMVSPALGEAGHSLSERRKKRNFGRKKGNSIPDYVIVPETVFSLSEKPIYTLSGHQDAISDLSWSRSQLLLSSSMDKTVRLWHVESQSCLKMFAHNDYVTCIQFNPVDDDYFISGSLDSKVRIWNISERKVVDWTDLKEMVTATCYTLDGKGATIGSHRGSCRYYTTTDCKLEQQDQFDSQNKKKSQIRKVTGFQYSPWNPPEVLISTADSRIRIHDGSSFTHKFKGFRNTCSQISASYSPDGKYVISASEDSQVYVWRREDPKNGGNNGKCKRVIVTAHEHFPCKDVSVAIPWPGSLRNETPTVELHSKRHLSKRFLLPQYPAIGSPTDHHLQSGHVDYRESELRNGVAAGGESPTPSFSGSASIGSSPSRSWPSSRFDNGAHHGVHTVQATAWGMVIVTASLGGEIRVYQNFGLPVKASRQSNLFRDLT